MPDLKDISVTFHASTANERKALDHPSFHVEDGDFISVPGINSAGKNTSPNVISGTIPCDSGTTLPDGEDITAYLEYKRAREIGCLFQDPLKGTALYTITEENLGLAYNRGKWTTLSRAIKKGDRSFFIEEPKELGLGLEDCISVTVGLLSRGQRQTLTLLMSTIVAPKPLLLDEHTAVLDPKTAASIVDITEKIVKENHITTPVIMHNMKQALEYGNKMTVLNEGKIVKVLEGEKRKNITVDGLLNVYDFI